MRPLRGLVAAVLLCGIDHSRAFGIVTRRTKLVQEALKLLNEAGDA
jgi:hypothetical protein